MRKLLGRLKRKDRMPTSVARAASLLITYFKPALNSLRNSIWYSIHWWLHYSDIITDSETMFRVIGCLLLWAILTGANDPYIVFSRRGGLDRMNLDGSQIQNILQLPNSNSDILVLDFDYDQDAIFYSKGSPGPEEIRRCSLTGQNDQLVTDLATLAYGLTLDKTQQKLYRSNTRGKLFRTDYSGANRETLVANPTGYQYGIFDVAVDTVNGKMYWTEWWQKEIKSANLDGSGITTVRQGGSGLGEPRGLALDVANQKLYFAAYFNYNNIKLHVLDMAAGIEYPILTGLREVLAVHLHNNQLYFTEHVANTGTIKRCATNGNGLHTVASNLNYPRGIAVITSGPDQPIDGGWSEFSEWTECTVTCGGGTRSRGQICNNPAPSSNGAPCPGPGIEIEDCNVGDCTDVFMMFCRDGGIDRINLDGTNRQTMMTYNPTTSFGGSTALPYALAYDFIEKLIFYSTNKKQIRRCTFTGDADTHLADLWSYGLAVDSRNKKLYWTDYEQVFDTRHEGGIRVSDYDMSNTVTLVFPIQGPRGLFLDLDAGKIYWIEFWSDAIKSANLDGTDITTLRIGTGVIATTLGGQDLAIDTAGGKVYWMAVEHAGHIHVLDMNTLAETDLTPVYMDTAVDVHEDYVYFMRQDNFNGFIHRIDKDGTNLVTLASDVRYPRDMVVVHPDPGAVSVWAAWGPWGACTTTCGPGTRTRTRTCHDSGCTGITSQDTDCNEGTCEDPVDGGWSEWSEWTPCGVTCGAGTRSRSRTCDNPAPAYGGAGCSGSMSTSEPCTVEPDCSADPVSTWSTWGPWSACTETCDQGIRTRTRTCPVDYCPGWPYEVQDCNAGDCTGPRPVGWEERKNTAACALFVTVDPGFVLVGVSSTLPETPAHANTLPNCQQTCSDQGMYCMRSLKLYPDPARRLSRGEEQIHAYRVCNTKYANVCCCIDRL